MLAPPISVVLAVRNGEPHIEASVRSILGQTFEDLELIVVDDGSTDGTSGILEALRRADSRVQVLHQENRGLAASLNRGIELARGAYIARQDADDLSLPQRIERQLAFLRERPSVVAIGCGADVIDDSGRTIGLLTAARGPMAVRRGLMTLRTTPVHGSMMMRTAAIRAIGGYRDAFSVGQDYDLWLRLSSRYEMDNIPAVLYQWRLDSKSVYATRRATQLRYAGIALTFAQERVADGHDSYERLATSGGDLEHFIAEYPLAPFVYALWGELLLRGLGNTPLVRQYFRRALLGGNVRPWVVALFCWAHLRLPWPGGRPLALPDAGRGRL